MSELFGNPEQVSELSGNPEQLPYTPTTEEVMKIYRWSVATERYGLNAVYKKLDIQEAEFDRWLAEVKADAWDEGYTQGNNDMYNGDFPTHNPYRQESNA